MCFGLLFAPIRGVIRLGEILRDQAEDELRDRASIRRELEYVEEERSAGRISPEEAQYRQQRTINRLAGDAPVFDRREGDRRG